MAVPSVPNVGLQRVMARNAARGAAHKLVQTDTSNLKNIRPMRLGDMRRRLDPSDGPVKPLQIPAEPNETALAAPRPASCSAAGGVRTHAAKSPSTIRHRRACVATLRRVGQPGGEAIILHWYTTEQHGQIEHGSRRLRTAPAPPLIKRGRRPRIGRKPRPEVRGPREAAPGKWV